MRRREFIAVLTAITIGAPPGSASAQTNGLKRIGVVYQGGPYEPSIDGLRDGLRVAGLEEGRDIALLLRHARGDEAAAEAAARAPWSATRRWTWWQSARLRLARLGEPLVITRRRCFTCSPEIGVRGSSVFTSNSHKHDVNLGLRLGSTVGRKGIGSKYALLRDMMIALDVQVQHGMRELWGGSAGGQALLRRVRRALAGAVPLLR